VQSVTGGCTDNAFHNTHVLSDKVTEYFTLFKNCAFLETFVQKVTNQIVTLFRSECSTSNA
jgi:hypothetical protein